jgi:hypothetical protein
MDWIAGNSLYKSSPTRCMIVRAAIHKLGCIDQHFIIVFYNLNHKLIRRIHLKFKNVNNNNSFSWHLHIF